MRIFKVVVKSHKHKNIIKFYLLNVKTSLTNTYEFCREDLFFKKGLDLSLVGKLIFSKNNIKSFLQSFNNSMINQKLRIFKVFHYKLIKIKKTIIKNTYGININLLNAYRFKHITQKIRVHAP